MGPLKLWTRRVATRAAKAGHERPMRPPDGDVMDAVRRYVHAYVRLHGMQRTSAGLGVSRHTLWRFLERRHVGRAVPQAVLAAVGDSVEALEAATARVIAATVAVSDTGALSRATAPPPHGERASLLALCATPLTSVAELARFTRVPATTLRDRLTRLARKGLVDLVAHRLDCLGPQPQHRYFPTVSGIGAAARSKPGIDTFLRTRPVSRRWFRLLTDRLDAVAVLYRFAALVADADEHHQPVRVEYYRQGPYDMRITLASGVTIGVLRQGATLPSAHLRYRLRSAEKLPYLERPTITLVMACSDQANRRAVRTLGHPVAHMTLFVATEREVLAGDHRTRAWQRCGGGLANNPPVEIAPEASLQHILRWGGKLLEHEAREYGFTPKPSSLVDDGLRATMPSPPEQVRAALAVQLTPAEKQVLDTLAAWPLATTAQLSGLLGGVTRRRVNQVLRSLRRRGLVRSLATYHVLTDAGLTHLARRDRAAGRIAVGRWSPRPWRPRPGAARVFAGSALRTMASQLRHQDAVTTVAAALTAECARSPDHELVELLPTHRASIGYFAQGANYVLHPDAFVRLSHGDETRPYFVGVERRATTPRRACARLGNYFRYFTSCWAEPDHGGQTPIVLFVFANAADEATFRSAVDVDAVPLVTSHLPLLAERGVLGDVWHTLATHHRPRLALHRLTVRNGSD